MAAAPALPPPLREGDRLTREEFLRRWEAMPDLKRAELIDGVVHMPSPVSAIHADFHSTLSGWLMLYRTATPGCVSGSGSTWLMAGDNVPQPDLHLLIQPEYGGQSRVETYRLGAPELVVEISHTTSSKDAGAKLRLYERSGVREYLIVQPGRRQLAWRELESGAYRVVEAGDDGIFRSRVFPGLWLDAAALWNDDVQALLATLQRGLTSPEHAEFVRALAARRQENV